MRKVCIPFCIFLISSITLGAQANQFTTADESDPAAKEILVKVKEQFDGSPSFEASFELLMTIPGMEDQREEGTLFQEKEKYDLDMNVYHIISNTELRWVYLKAQNEVNIYNAEGSEDWITPRDFLQIYDSPDFAYVLLPDQAESDKSLHFIEFKPLDRNSEYVKIRLAVFKNNNRIHSVKAFGRDGDRYELNILSIDFKPKRKTPSFVFDPSLYPGIKIEDLRID